MHIARRAAIAALSTAALTAGGLAGAGSAASSTPAKVPVVVAHISGKSISLSTGATIHAGRVLFRVVCGKGVHFLQVARLRHGYTLAQAQADLPKAFGGDVAVVRRIDRNINFRGGAEARPQRPGLFGITLFAGRYLLIDQNSNAHRFLTVTGSPPLRARIPHKSVISVFTYGFDTMPTVIPASGRTRIVNRSDQPHFVEINHVKASTTAAMVRKFFASGAQGRSSFGLKANAGSGVISPNRGQILRYNLPAGKYVVACFWPDDTTGMPHAFMGMWKLIRLK